MQRTHRLTNRDDFKKVYRRGKSVANRQFVVYSFPRRNEEPFRMGVSISKKIGNAVVRNRLKRQLKEIVRLRKDEIADGYDFIIIVRKGALSLDYHAMEKSVFHVLRRASLLR